MRMKISSLPYLRIEHYDSGTDPKQFSVNGFVYLILGQTVLREVPTLELPRLVEFGIKVLMELERLGVQIRRTLVDVSVPESENPKVLWFPER